MTDEELYEKNWEIMCRLCEGRPCEDCWFNESDYCLLSELLDRFHEYRESFERMKKLVQVPKVTIDADGSKEATLSAWMEEEK